MQNRMLDRLRPSRRNWATIALILAFGGWAAAQAPQPPRNVSITRAGSGRGVLQASDFTYLGYYEVDVEGLNTVWMNTFTHRYVGGELRFLSLNLRGELVEFAAPSGLGGFVRVTQRWQSPFTGASWTVGSRAGIWWDQAGQKLWSTDAIDYPDDKQMYETVNIATRTLNDDGTISNLRRVTLEGVGARRAYGGCQMVPASWRTQWGLLPYVCGWGGGTSRIAQGLSASLGPTAYGFPDPTQLPNGGTFSRSQFRTYMEYPFQGGDWYANGRPTVGDRGVRNSDVINYLDGGDPRQNPSTMPDFPPVAGARWLSPAPDGMGRMTWNDSFFNTGMTIDGAQLYGFALVGCFYGGKAFYRNSQTENEKRVFELQIFDPAQWAEAAAGKRETWNVKPVSRAVLTLPGLGLQGNSVAGCTAGASYDPIAKRAYVYGTWAITPENRNRVYVYDVAGQ